MDINYFLIIFAGLGALLFFFVGWIASYKIGQSKIVNTNKYTTNQSLMRDLKNETKEFQKEMRELKNDPKKMMEVQKKAMETNMKYMMHSFKPMIFTFIPIIIIFGWMNAHFAYYPIMPGEEFTASAVFEELDGNITLVSHDGIELLSDAAQSTDAKTVTWRLKGEQEGDYTLWFDYEGKEHSKELSITNEKSYKEPMKRINEGNLKAIQIDHKPVKVLNLFIGGWKLGWIGTYIVFSLIFSMVIRKKLKIY